MGWVYVLRNTNKRFEGVYKIGHTTKAKPEDRAREVTNGTGVIGKYIPEGVYQVYQSEAIERYVHRLLARKRVQNDREFFEATLEEIDAAIREAVANTGDQLGPGTRAVVTEERRLEEEKRRSAARRKAEEDRKHRERTRLNEETARKLRKEGGERLKVAWANRRKLAEELGQAQQQAVEAEKRRRAETDWEKYRKKERLENTLLTLSMLCMGGFLLPDSVGTSIKGVLLFAFLAFGGVGAIVKMLPPKTY